VVGGGRVAARKVAALAACGARVTVVAPDVVPSIEALEGVTVARRPYRAGEAAGYRLVITATCDPAVDRAVHDDADAAGVWVNAADDPANCSFTLPAVTRKGPVTVAVATDGTSPALAAWLRDVLADALPDRIEELAAALAAERAEVQAAGTSTEGLDWMTRIDALVAELARPTHDSVDVR
jgi:siroheme synthase-like protein